MNLTLLKASVFFMFTTQKNNVLFIFVHVCNTFPNIIFPIFLSLWKQLTSRNFQRISVVDLFNYFFKKIRSNVIKVECNIKNKSIFSSCHCFFLWANNLLEEKTKIIINKKNLSSFASKEGVHLPQVLSQ